MSVRAPRRRYGWDGRSMPADYGRPYAQADVVPGDRIVTVDYGEAIVLSYDDPSVQAHDDFFLGSPARNDGYVYAQVVDTGEIDGFPPGSITKL